MKKPTHAALAFACLVSFLSSVSPPAQAATTNEILQAIESLGASDHKTRQTASQVLSEAGTDAVPFLEKAAKDPDPEIRLRAGEILPLARLGLPANFPSELRDRVLEYLKATPEARAEILKQLSAAGKAVRPVLIALAKSEKDFQIRALTFEPALSPIEEHLTQVLNQPHPDKTTLMDCLDDIEFYQIVLPEDPQLPLTGIRQFDAQKLTPQADAIFDRAFHQEEKICAEHAEDMEMQNNVAWLCAVARRQLDAGLRHIQIALAKSPDDAPYLDTKAELLFQQGHRDEALALIARCVKSTPETPYFKRQEARIKAGDPSVPPPEVDIQ